MVHHEFSEEGRKARFEQWEKYGADRLKNDLQTDPYRRVHRRRRRASSRRASRPKSSSQVTLCWRKADSNPRSRLLQRGCRVLPKGDPGTTRRVPYKLRSSPRRGGQRRKVGSAAGKFLYTT